MLRLYSDIVPVLIYSWRNFVVFDTSLYVDICVLNTLGWQTLNKNFVLRDGLCTRRKLIKPKITQNRVKLHPLEAEPSGIVLLMLLWDFQSKCIWEG